MKLEQQFVDFKDRIARLEEWMKYFIADKANVNPPVPPSECVHEFWTDTCSKCGMRYEDSTPSDEPKVTMEDVLIEEMRRDECKHPDGFRTSSYAEGKLITTCLKCNTSWDNDGKDYPGQIHIADEPKCEHEWVSNSGVTVCKKCKEYHLSSDEPTISISRKVASRWADVIDDIGGTWSMGGAMREMYDEVRRAIGKGKNEKE
jgi:hypothetical protein